MTLKEWLDSERKGPRGKVRPQRGTQEWLADKLDCQQALVSKWVRRITTPEMYGTKIVRLSRGKVTLEELLSEREWAKALVGARVVVGGHEASGERVVRDVASFGVVRLSAPVGSLTHWRSVALKRAP